MKNIVSDGNIIPIKIDTRMKTEGHHSKSLVGLLSLLRRLRPIRCLGAPSSRVPRRYAPGGKRSLGYWRRFLGGATFCGFRRQLGDAGGRGWGCSLPQWLQAEEKANILVPHGQGLARLE